MIVLREGEVLDPRELGCIINTKDTDMEHQFKPWQPVLVRDSDVLIWKANFFSHYRKDREYPFVCVWGSYRQCIPAEGNEHLIGTNNSPTPPEPEFKFGDKVEVSDNNKVFYEAIFIRERVFTMDTLYEAITRGKMVSTCFRFCRHADW